jgi:hypothetical protein
VSKVFDPRSDINPKDGDIRTDIPDPGGSVGIGGGGP